jgi:flavin reductase (DIM6/NTAB) family NADH-FMN oxidoreductase RutF
LPERSISDLATELAPYGIWGCGLRTREGPSAIIVTWVTQLSFTPTLMGVALETGGSFLEHVLASGEFTLSSLPKAGGKEIAAKILKTGLNHLDEEQTALFRDEPGWEEGIKGAAATLKCKVTAHHPCGDHTFVVAAVTAEQMWKRNEEVLLLSDTGWKYHRPLSVKQNPPTD